MLSLRSRLYFPLRAGKKNYDYLRTSHILREFLMMMMTMIR